MIASKYKGKTAKGIGTMSLIKTNQFFGIDIKPFAVELPKVTLMNAKKLAIVVDKIRLSQSQINIPNQIEEALPLDNLNDNIQCSDALLNDWPEADIIIGNPPYQSKNKMQKELGVAYLNKVRQRYPSVPGRADYCVYWFRIAHDNLSENGRAGLVGTNTIRQNFSREGSLDYISSNGGTLTEAVATQVWSGDAVVHVSIVNWIKGNQSGPKRIYTQLGDDTHSPWKVEEVETIEPTLSTKLNITTAFKLNCNTSNKSCFQGQTHGHEGFLLDRNSAEEILKHDPEDSSVLYPYLIGEELLSGAPIKPKRYVIDFSPRDIIESSRHKQLFAHIENHVLPTRQESANNERQKNAEALSLNPKAKVNKHHSNFLSKWWQLSYPRQDLIKKSAGLHRVICCCQVTKRPIFEFVSTKIRPNAA